MVRRSSIVYLLAAIAWAAPAQPNAAVQEALAAMQRGQFHAAEGKLRAELKEHPGDAAALSLLGAALDEQHETAAAAHFHQQALAAAPLSTSVLTNYAAHLMISGKLAEARQVYARILALDPANENANVQCARLALGQGDGPAALKFVSHLPAGRQDSPPILLLRLPALYMSGSNAEGDRLMARIATIGRSDVGLSVAAAQALAAVQQYGKAEAMAEAALRADPADFNLLYALGVMASYAGHYARARDVLEVALRQQPDNVDALYALARANEALKQWPAAVGLLVRAEKFDPQRTDVEKLLAVTAAELGAFEDAAKAWERYRKLRPEDDLGRREQSYNLAQMGQTEQGIAGLEAFVARYPGDAVGHCELGQALLTRDAEKARQEFDHAIELDPQYVPARTARGSLYYQEGKPEAALPDLEAAASLRPDDPAVQDRLGQAYQALDRPQDAVRALRKAAELAPDDSKILLHFARALADAGNVEESKTVMNLFRGLKLEKTTDLRAGFVDYMRLSDAERRADYRARVEKAMREHPNDAAARLAWLQLAIADGNAERVAEAARALVALKPDANVLAEAGRALLEGNSNGLARELLRPAAAAVPSAEIELDLATATLRYGDAAAAIRELESIPEPARGGDYYLLRAEALGAERKDGEAAAAMDEALRLAPPNTDFYRRAAALLARTGKVPLALRFLNQGARQLPGDREILLLRATALESTGDTTEALRLLSDLEARWPEWFPAWVARAIVQKAHGRAEDARRDLETAAVLGAPADKSAVTAHEILEGALFR
jgi:cellulose synthase operon protein C